MQSEYDVNFSGHTSLAEDEQTVFHPVDFWDTHAPVT